MIYDIDQGYGDTYSFGELTMTTNNASLSQSMISSIVNKTTKNNTTETIDKILCP
jgi:hypothetical protein